MPREGWLYVILCYAIDEIQNYFDAVHYARVANLVNEEKSLSKRNRLLPLESLRQDLRL